MGWALIRQLREPGSSAMLDSRWSLDFGLRGLSFTASQTTSNVARHRRSECRRVLFCVTRTRREQIGDHVSLNFERWLLLLYELTLTERAAAGDATAKLRKGRLLRTYGNLREQGARLDLRFSLRWNSKA